jgi:large subunit ribosomal protein L19
MSNILLQKSPVVTSQIRTDLPDFKVGSLVEVAYKIIEGGKERIQTFKGIVTNIHEYNTMNATFTVLKNSTFNTKVERTFPTNSPLIASVIVTNFRRARRGNIRTQMTVKDPRNIRSRQVPVKAATAPIPVPAPKTVETQVETVSEIPTTNE